jgi:hypothetical protein
MYTRINFKSKKELKAAVDLWNAYLASPPDMVDGVPVRSSAKVPQAVRYFQPGPFGGAEPREGIIYLEGPHYPEPHRWYAQAVAENGVIVKVK